MADMTKDDARQLVRDAGLRATAPRIAVLQLLSRADKPMSHSEVVDAIGTADWDQATLYRNLVKLVEADLARVASKVAGVSRYEARGDDDEPHLHPHFSCRVCGDVVCLPEARLAGTVDRKWRKSVATSELELIGECPKCLAEQRGRRATRRPAAKAKRKRS